MNNISNLNKEWTYSLLLALLSVLAPIKPVLITVFVLVIVDLLTGIWAAYKRGEQIKSSGLRRTISKITVYGLCIICGFCLETYLIDGLVPVVKLIGGAIGVVEMKSILENGDSIMGQSLFKALIEKLGSDNDVLKK